MKIKPAGMAFIVIAVVAVVGFFGMKALDKREAELAANPPPAIVAPAAPAPVEAAPQATQPVPPVATQEPAPAPAATPSDRGLDALLKSKK